jgi:cation transport ATPase
MTHLFYFVGLIFLIYEISFLFSIKEKLADSKDFKEKSKEYKGKKWDEYSEEYKSEIIKKSFLLIFLMFFFVGLFTQQWFTFLVFLILQFVVFLPLSKLVGYSPLRYLTTGLNTLLGIVFSLFVIVNHYHLHIDTFQFFTELWVKYIA